MTTSVDSVLQEIKEELQKIKTTIITEEKLIQILREELGSQEIKYKNGFEKLQRQILQIKISNNLSKNSGLDFTDFQFPPSLPYAKPFESHKKEKEKLIIKD